MCNFCAIHDPPGPPTGGLSIADCAAVLERLFVFPDVFEAFSELSYAQACVTLQMIDHALDLHLGIYTDGGRTPQIRRNLDRQHNIWIWLGFPELNAEIVIVQRDPEIREIVDFALPSKPFTRYVEAL